MIGNRFLSLKKKPVTYLTNTSHRYHPLSRISFIFTKTKINLIQEIHHIHFKHPPYFFHVVFSFVANQLRVNSANDLKLRKLLNTVCVQWLELFVIVIIVIVMINPMSK